MTTNKPEVIGFGTHHDEPMLFPSKREAAMYCDDGEEPVALIRLSDYEALQAERDEALAKLSAIESQEPVIRISGGRVVDFNPNYGGSVSEGAFYAKPVPAGKPAVAVPDGALAMLNQIIAELEGGFVSCQRCGDQAETANLDCMHDLKKLRNLLAAAPSHSQQSAATVPADYRLLAEKLITKACCDAVERLSEIAPGRGWDSGETVAEMYIRQLRALSDRPSHDSEQGGDV